MAGLEATASVRGGGHAELMDRVYRVQRAIYDPTRKFFLFGRDTLLAQMRLRDGERVLELGCGTARNLLILARRPEHIDLFGLDASNEMLTTARRKLAALGRDPARRIVLRQGLAEQVLAHRPFGDVTAFDHVVFSYTLSMIPVWREAVDEGLRLLRDGGTLHVVDFWDQADMPRWFGKVLTWWLSLFHVRPNPELIGYLHEVARRSGAGTRLSTRPLWGRYSVCVTLTKAASGLGEPAAPL